MSFNKPNILKKLRSKFNNNSSLEGVFLSLLIMKILHTADWHLGKKLEKISRLSEQILVLEEIIAIADKEEVDAVLIAGDLFDNFNPSSESIELFYKTLKK